MINRFDLIYVILNKPTICEDYLVARQIFKNNCHSYENSNTDSLTKIQKYITFAKEYIHPIWLEKSNEKVLKFYKCLKNFSNVNLQSYIYNSLYLKLTKSYRFIVT